jgi:hypothetical protein
MDTYPVAPGTALHCNRNECGTTFAAPAGIERFGFSGSHGTRITTMIRCPNCGTVDGHWVYAADVTPVFTGNFDARKAAERRWLMTN